MAYNEKCINYIFNINNADISCLGSAAESLVDNVSKEPQPGLKVWLILFVGLVAFAIPFVLKLRRSKFPHCNGDFEKLEKKYKKDTEIKDLLKEIDKLYSDKKKMRDSLISGEIYRRKANLLEHMTEQKRTKEFWAIILGAVFSAFLAAFMEGNILGFEINDMGAISQNLVASVLVGFLGLFVSFLFNNVMYDFDDERVMIRKYELELINKIIDRYAEGKLSAGTVIVRRRKVKRYNSYREFKNITTETTKYPTWC